MPSYSVSEVNFANRNSNPFNYSNSGALDTVTTNSLNDFYPSISVNDDNKQSISQILKEANSLSVIVNNTTPEVKPKVTDDGNRFDPDNRSLFQVVVVEDRQEIDLQNNEIRKQLHRLVRRPGKNFTELFDNIKTLKGNTEVQVKMVELIIKESLRFKRQHLAHLLEEYVQSLLSVENK
jgi:integrator complex subunit 6